MITSLLATLATGFLPTSIRVEGEGYLRFALDGRIVYSKSANLVSRDGKLSEASGATIMPLFMVPDGANPVQIAEDGTITVSVGQNNKELGRLTLAMFTASESLVPQGAYLIARTRPKLEYPGEGRAGKLVQSEGLSANQAIVTKPKSKNQQPTTSNSKPQTLNPIPLLAIPDKVVLTTGRMTVDQFIQGEVPDSLKQRMRLADFGAAPKSGFSTKITRSRIETKLLMVGIEAKDARFQIPEIVEVCSPSQNIDSKTIIAAALQAASEKSGGPHELKVEGNVEPYQAPLGAIELKTDSIIERGSQILVTVAIFVDGKRINSKQITFSGELAPIVIKAGDLVKVEMRASGISVEVTGRAKKGGRVGESIEVEVSLGEPPVKTSHLAVIKAPGKVEVKL